MNRTKALSVFLVTAVFAAVFPAANAELIMSTSADAVYQQNKKGDVDFRSGRYFVDVSDGNGIYEAGCYWPYYVAPYNGPCGGGSTGYVSFGSIGKANEQFPYFWITQVIPALIIAPSLPELCILRAAPASELPRPSSEFIDDGFGIYYNLHTVDVSEYLITRYFTRRNYNSNQGRKFDEEIVPGAYYYSFPRKDNVELSTSINPTIYPMAKGFRKISKQKVGVKYFNSDDGWTKNGFMLLDTNKPIAVSWRGLTTSNAYGGVDDLYFSLKYLRNPRSSKSDISEVDPITGDFPASLFPGYTNGDEPRVRLANPYVRGFTLPPVFRSGTRAMAQLDLVRNLRTSGVTYDDSVRTFRVPVFFRDEYAQYGKQRFRKEYGKPNTEILKDYDKDGFNNLTEWILESRAEDDTSVPENPVPVYNDFKFNTNLIVYDDEYFGFTVERKRGTVPKVREILQRSFDGGRTWQNFMDSDANWIVIKTYTEIRVESNVVVNGFRVPVQPPGTEKHLYRVKVVLEKKNKKKK